MMGRPVRSFQAFATAVGRRYGDRVGLWSIWNEPNHPQFLKPQFVHIMFEGRIVKQGGPELVELIENEGYASIRAEVGAAS